METEEPQVRRQNARNRVKFTLDHELHRRWSCEHHVTDNPDRTQKYDDKNGKWIRRIENATRSLGRSCHVSERDRYFCGGEVCM